METTFYVHNNPKTKGFPKYTVCGILDEKREYLNIGIAFCSNRDNFCKKTGREIAHARATNQYITIPIIDEDIDMREIRNIFYNFCSSINHNYDVYFKITSEK